MKTIKLTEELRRSINKYLDREYGACIPSGKDDVVDEGRDYLYMDEDSSNMFYIPKRELNNIKQN